MNTGEAVIKGFCLLLVWLIGAAVLVPFLGGMVDAGIPRSFAGLLWESYLFGFPLATFIILLIKGMEGDFRRGTEGWSP